MAPAFWEQRNTFASTSTIAGAFRSPPISVMVNLREAPESSGRLEAQRAPPVPMSIVASLRSAGIRSPGRTLISSSARNRWSRRFSSSPLASPPGESYHHRYTSRPLRRVPAARGSAGEVVRHAGDHNPRLEQQRPFDQEGRLVVEQPLPPVGGDELGKDDRHHLVAPAAVHQIVNVIDELVEHSDEGGWRDERTTA